LELVVKTENAVKERLSKEINHLGPQGGNSETPRTGWQSKCETKF